MSEPTLPTSEDVIGLLRGVIDPELGSDIVTLGMAKGATVSPDGFVRITVALTTAGCPLRAQIQRDVRDRVGSLPGVTKVKIDWTELTAEEKATTMATARRNIAERAPVTAIPATTKVLMIASGKGGVGKSSVTVNLATALAATGFKVGVIDADIWGFSVPRMLGVDGRLEAGEADGRIAPHRQTVGRGELRIVSMGFLVDDEETALMWRGLILQRAVRHFLEDVDWGHDLDYLLIDMPPGTGDVQMGLAKLLPRAEMIVVTTPSLSAQKVAVRAVNMGRQNYLRIIGVVENMSEFVTPDGERFAIFGTGGGQRLAKTIGAPLLARIPIENAVAEGGDTGTPIALGDGAAAEAFRELAHLLSTDIAPPVDLAGCSVRLLDAVNAALDAHDSGANDSDDDTKVASPVAGG
ncbi:MAG TPA: Mrp/NBP35 family ATP-binding protein [Microthrixaceae bacterium]|nr:Mrp/NBP35 family ATP-binding protein [Microthrixaceae bacterium]